MTVPGRLTLLTAALLALLLLVAVLTPLAALAALGGDLLLIVACLVQGARLKRLAVSVEREPWGRVQVGQEAQFPYRIANRSARAVTVRLRQRWPTSVDAVQNVLELRLAPGEVVVAALMATAKVRGVTDVAGTEVEVRLPSDWARRRWTIDPGQVKVFPNLTGLTNYETLRRQRATAFGGLHAQRQLGSGREFDQLRDYGPDDDYRDVNWKATARRRRPITNIYRAERSRDVLLCIDCGRMMGNPVGAGTALDHAIDASIMLAHVANRQGDRIGLALFRDVVHRFVKPAAGMPAVHRVIEELVDARTEGVFPSYAALLSALRMRQNRRSLILLFTDLNDPQLATNLAEVLPLAARRHVLVVISLRDPLLDRAAAAPANDGKGVYSVLAARQLATERATRTRELTKIGAMVVEADAGSLTVKLLNAYLSIKARQIL